MTDKANTNASTDSSTTKHSLWVIVPAAGCGKRLGGDVPKQYLQVSGKTILDWVVLRLLSVPQVAGVILVLSKDDAHWSASELASHSKIVCAEGGAERSDSVKSGLLKYCELQGSGSEGHQVLVHDAVRPCVSVSDIEALIENVWGSAAGGLLACPLVDTLKRVNNNEVEDTIDRDLYWRAQTPQMFKVEDLLKGIEVAKTSSVNITDEASLIEGLKLKPKVVEGSTDNIKLTYQADIPLIEAILKKQAQKGE